MASAVKKVVSAATGKTKKKISVSLEFGTEHGHQIFVYQHFQTRRVIYSLTRVMKNAPALRQLTFVGKKTVPSALRKDHWTPLCVLSFPHPHQGLHAYTKLREYRHLHELAWDPASMTKNNGATALSKKERSKKLMDQKANSIADMAAVLALQARPPTLEAVEKAKRMVRTDGRPIAKKGPGSLKSHNIFEFQGRVDGTSVWWADILDAEYAETWPEKVVHGRLAVNRGKAVWPPPEELVSREVEVEAGKEAEESGWMEAAVNEQMEERRRLLRRESEVDVKEKIRETEDMAREAKRREEGVQQGKGDGKAVSWFESTRRLFPTLAGQRGGEASVAATSA